VAVEPSTGESFVLLLPRTTGACLAAFLQAFRRAVPERRIAFVLDGSGSHTSQRVAWPDDLMPVPLPAYSPELNPAERLFERLRRALANQVLTISLHSNGRSPRRSSPIGISPRPWLA
jgi:transposase